MSVTPQTTAHSDASSAEKAGIVYWLTGLSGAGKTTTARGLVKYLRAAGHSVIMLDGDELREAMGATDAHTGEERLNLALRYARLCKMLADQGVDVVIATISMFSDVYAWNRAHIVHYCEIFLDVPVSELQKRDPKKIYERAQNGEISNVAGLDLEVDIPASPDIHVVWTEKLTAQELLNTVIEEIKQSI